MTHSISCYFAVYDCYAKKCDLHERGYLMIRSRLKASVSAEVVRFTLKLFKQSGHVSVGKAVSGSETNVFCIFTALKNKDTLFF